MRVNSTAIKMWGAWRISQGNAFKPACLLSTPLHYSSLTRRSTGRGVRFGFVFCLFRPSAPVSLGVRPLYEFRTAGLIQKYEFCSFECFQMLDSVFIHSKFHSEAMCCELFLHCKISCSPVSKAFPPQIVQVSKGSGLVKPNPSLKRTRGCTLACFLIISSARAA